MNDLFIDRDGFTSLLECLKSWGYELIGPTVRDGAIVFAPIGSADDLPRGVREIQGAGSYRVESSGNDRFFGFVSGPDSAKRFLFPPREVFRRIERSGRELKVHEVHQDQNYAFIGLRACDLAAVSIQDRVFLSGPGVLPGYQQRRNAAFFVGVDCTQPAANCFCTSMGHGPICSSGYDISLTELDYGFLARAASERGEQALRSVPSREATDDEMAGGRAATREAESSMGRELDASGLAALLLGSRESARWEDVAERCVACGNCTAVCPTCFCHDVTDASDLLGASSERAREWATCFSVEFSHTASGDVRTSGASRYRQWLTHKFGTWIDQFGASGCVGCGRCITWCPVGIDVTEELAALREEAGAA